MRNIKSEIIAAILVLLFAYTAIQKYIDHNTFLLTLKDSPLFHHIAGLISWIVPITEFGVVSLLLFPTLRKTGLFLAALLLASFTLYIGYMLIFIPNLPCSCGGIISLLSWKQHLVFNIFFTSLATYGWYDIKSNKNIAIRRSPTPVT
ncbi:MauE/DoxX family redox-associated membrane protein [Pinibacter aurantiacus]|uniref:Methylamine utilisation protein MauE domain-containing protein n=1 Tax=Pinibacter aurantiacus TaxID=2851599 RepID=A0A9E2S7J7_9BACT|nr:MauE/DoxX family redox-associated membrane protein [Pinibacter aurantiacus]MBV4357326.1 hypothetical protein [Pinibacter aurantiacus]